ncbi:cytochrome c [Verrucomicrobiaceae bacterium 227]
MKPSGLLLCLAIILIPWTAFSQLKIREDFRESPAHIPVVDSDLTSPFLKLRRIGKGADQLKLSHHPEVKNDPYYLWNGLCKGPVLIGFTLKDRLDLSDPKWHCRLKTKNVGASRLHLAVQVEGLWYLQKEAVENQKDWNLQSLPLSGATWRRLSSKTAIPGKEVKAPDLRKVTSIGFAAPVTPKGSQSCIRLDWFELTKSTKPTRRGRSGFLEPDAPFLRSALLIKNGKEFNHVRRGVLIPLGDDHWACFDPDLLRWAAIWKAPAGQPPLSYDSMAAISYPQGTTKAKAVPSLRGNVITQSPELPGVGSPRDSRAIVLNAPATKVGPLPASQGRWLGLHLFGKTPILHYLVGRTHISEMLAITPSLQRVLKVEPNTRPLRFHVGAIYQHLHGENASLSDGLLTLHPSKKTRIIVLGAEPVAPCQFPEPSPAAPIDTKALSVHNPPPHIQGSFTIRPIDLPTGERFIRPTDIAFLSNGTGLVSTLDGDIWKVEEIESQSSHWSRIATGIFEPISLETTSDDRIFVLGRDQVTELIDENGDTIIDSYRNASDAFQQTLQTRDYATSLAIQPDGSFLIAKGGIHSEKSKSDNELSIHRGTIIRLGADGLTAEVLAEGLRLPYVGLRNDGTVFASDQQGNYIPSTPIHLIGKDRPYLGHTPTNFHHVAKPEEPLLWYPYQTNRSGAAFATTAPRAFPDLGEAFLQVSWGGRLFAIATPDRGQPFSWQLPLQLDFPSLNATSHPKSGRLYVTGIGISGYKPTTPALGGLASIEQSASLPVPLSMDVNDRTIQVTFNRPLSADETIIPASPALRMFNIKRSPQYGSGHFKWDQQPGEQRFQPTTFTISDDRRTLTLAFDSLYRSDILDLSLTVTSGPHILPLHLFSRPAHLPLPEPQALAQLAKLEKMESTLKPGDAARGKHHFTNFACAGCHSLDTTKLVGPSLKGIASRANEPLLRQSILEPNAVITKGYPAAMPSFAGVLTKQELADLLAYLATLR